MFTNEDRPWDCYGSPDESDDFYSHSPCAYSCDRRHGPGAYHPIIRVPVRHLTNGPFDADAIHSHWLKTGKIATMPDRDAKRDDDDSTILFSAYHLDLNLGPTAANFRDAVIDAVAKYFDTLDVQYGRFPNNFSFKVFFDAVKNTPDSALGRLVVFYTALSVYFGDYDERLPSCSMFRQKVERQVATFATRTRCYDIWDGFMLGDRCRFHEHAEDGKCWRRTEEGPEMRSGISTTRRKSGGIGSIHAVE
jgi:hypothetical protein